MNRCGCPKPPKYVEYPIEETIKVNIYDFETPERDLTSLKRKVICEFLGIIDNLKCGILPDLENLLQEIALIYIYDE